MLVFDDRNYFRVNLKRSVQLALIAKVKRFFSPKTRIPKNKYINIGCGLHRFEGFDNLDFYNSSFSSTCLIIKFESTKVMNFNLFL